ncbi:hypothetical protein AMJ51_00930 [Microgenomates bacterium DG_75]|nr:MAG: hypothetical protein AMJ51_00930 [Microgenomates bacterium DG_75]
MNKKKSLHGLGVASKGKKIFLFNSFLSDRTSKLRLETSQDGLNFYQEGKQAKIVIGKKKKENLRYCRDFRISELKINSFFLTYKHQKGKKFSLCGALSKDLVHWQKTGKLASIQEAGMIVPHYKHKGRYFLYFGEKKIKIASSKDLFNWEISTKPVLPSTRLPKNSKIKIGNLAITKKGILLTYFQWKKTNSERKYILKTILLAKNEPNKPLRKSMTTIWRQPKKWRHKEIIPVGIIKLRNKLISYWQIKDEGIFAIRHPIFKIKDDLKLRPYRPILKRMRKNPILGPIVENFWESQAVFNPAAVYDKGKVHLVYRAVGDKAISALGYASSRDGIQIDERLKKPIYTPKEPFETNLQAPMVASPQFISGIGCGGCEDPRITKIDGRFYLTYNAWNGYEPPKVAITSISEDDFLNHRWQWKKSVLISNPDSTKVRNADRINKNWAIFPEKIKGKYAIIHSLCPEILIDYFDNLDFDGKTYIDSYWEWKPRKNRWDTFVRGIGPPPIKTKEGWLVLYRAATSDCGYKMGAMILDSTNPTKILYRSQNPILEPKSWYEIEGLKPRIVYGCGAVVIKNHLFVYYGGSDTVACVATAPLDKFLEQLKYGRPQLNLIKEKISLVYRYHG